MVTGSAALTEHVVSVDQVIDDTGGWNCGGYYARDIAAGGLGDTTFVPALAASSDGYFFRLAWWLGNARLRKYALAFGLDAKTGIDLPGENEGNWPTNAWELRAFGVPMEPSEACFLGIGQGAMQATPLQMVNVASAVINGGTLFRPQIVREIRSPGGRAIARFSPRIIRHVPVTAAALAAVRAGMAKVTDPGGTAYGLAIDGLPFSGKTGTVETERRQRAEHDVVRRVGADRASASCARGLRRPQRRLRRNRRGADRAPDPRQVLQQEAVHAYPYVQQLERPRNPSRAFAGRAAR